MGSEEVKFNSYTRDLARDLIAEFLHDPKITTVVSGGCHLGGIDAWAAELGRTLGLEVVEHLPKHRSWEGGYKQRNIKIAEDSDIVYCITVKELPDTYTGMRFTMCYHCGTDQHVKSGGCWTVKHARKIGKRGEVYVIHPEPKRSNAAETD